VAEKRTSLDVWILENNTVYREVPFTVVADWVQQGRLLEADRLRQSGTQDWAPLSELPAFAAYFPKAEPFRAEDQAEALEPVQMEFAWKRPRTAEEDDVDMVPLIDVSLVLLLFFMMTEAVGSMSLIKTPEAERSLVISNANMYWIGIERGGDGQSLMYSVGQGNNQAQPGDNGLSFSEVLERFDRHLGQEGGSAEVRIRADKGIPLGEINKLMRQLENRRDRGGKGGPIAVIYSEVSEKVKP
jgi:biopolymer transport protein ExbD